MFDVLLLASSGSSVLTEDGDTASTGQILVLIIVLSPVSINVNIITIILI